MPAPLSLDLRQRIVHAYLAGEGTIPVVATRFNVGQATVERYLALYRATGSLQARPHGGGPALHITEDQATLLVAWLEENPSLTQQELADRFTTETGGRVTQQTVSSTLRRIGHTRKKSPSTRASATGPMS